MQRVKSSNVTSIDALAKNLINRNNKSLNESTSNAKNTNTATSAAINAIATASANLLNRKKTLSSSKIMSSMNEDFDTASAHPQQAPQINPSSVSPSSPSSASSTSSISSSSSSSSSSYHHSQQQIQAAVQSLLQTANTPSSASSTSSSLNQQACNNQALAAAVAAAAAAGLNGANGVNINAKDLAKLNMDVKNFKLQDNNNNINHQSSQMLLQQQFNLNNLIGAATAAANNNNNNSNNMHHSSLFNQAQLDQSVLNLLSSSGLNFNANGAQSSSMNGKHKQNGKNGSLASPKRSYNKTAKQSPSSSQTSMLNDSNLDAAASLLAGLTSTSSLSLSSLSNPKQQQQQQQRNGHQRKNGDLIKGNSMSPSSQGNSPSCASDETESTSGRTISPPLLNMKGEPGSYHHHHHLHSQSAINGGSNFSSSSISSISSASGAGSTSSRSTTDENSHNRRQRNINGPIAIKADPTGNNHHHHHNNNHNENNDYDDLNYDDEDLDEDSRSLPQSHSPRSSSLAMNNHRGNNGNAGYDSSIINNEDNNNNNNNTNNDDNDLTPLDNEYMDDDRSDYDDEDDDEDDDLHTSDYNTTLNTTSQNNTPNRKSRGGKKQNKNTNKNASISSPTRSSSSPNQSRSISPSGYNDSHGAAFPNLAAVAAANGIDSTTAILAAQSLLQQQTPGLSFPSLAATGLLGDVHKEGKEGDKLDLANSIKLMSDAAAEALIAKAAAFAASEAVANGSKKRRTDRSELMNERIKKIKPVPADKKDDAYWERRRKNNEAAKRSRDLRRQKEDEIAVRASFLEQENLKLKAQVTILKAELSKLHFMLYNR